MRNRIIVLLLTAAMLLSSFSFVYANEEVDFNYSDAKFLDSLGIMQLMDEGEYSKYITREDFAYSTAKLMGLEGTSSTRYYTDLRAEGYAFGYINELAEVGVLSPSANDTFRPFDYITFDEAYKMLVTVLGYAPVANIRGGYPRGYNLIARTLKINEGDSTGNVTVANAVNMIYNVLKTCPYEVSRISEDGTTYYEGDDIYANSRFGLDYFEGTVRATHYGNLDDNNVLDAKTVKIGEETYGVSQSFDEREVLGSYAEFFCTDDIKSEIVYMKEITREEKIVIDIKNYVGYENNTVEYYQNVSDSKTLKRTLEANNIIYNGLPLRSQIRETLASLNKGTITLKDTDDNGKYDVMDIKDYKNFYIKFVDTSKLYNDLVYDDYINLDDIDSLSVYSNGAIVAVPEFAPKTGMSVAMSLNKTVADIRLSSVVTGEITAKYDDGIDIDGKTYTIDETYRETLFNEITLGNKYTFTVDFLGNISYAKFAETRRMTLGYIINVAEVSGAFDSKTKIKLISADGSKLDLECAEDIIIDAVKYEDESADKLINVLKNGKVHARQLIQYELDSDGKLKEIDTVKKNPGEDPKYSLQPAFDEVKSRWYHLGRYGLTAICTNDSVAFCIPKDGSTDEKHYYVGKGATSITDSNDCYWALDCYYAGEDSGYVDAIIGEMDINEYIPKTVIMYDKCTEALDSDGYYVYKMSGYFMGAVREYTLEEDVIGVDQIGKFNRGDLIVIQENQAGDVSVIEKVFDAKTKQPVNWKYETDKEILYVDGFKEHYCEELNLSFGYVRKNFGDVISMSKTPTSEISERLQTNKRLNMLYDAETETIQLVTGDKIVDYETAGESCMRVVHYMWYEEGRGVYLYN